LSFHEEFFFKITSEGDPSSINPNSFREVSSFRSTVACEYKHKLKVHLPYFRFPGMEGPKSFLVTSIILLLQVLTITTHSKGIPCSDRWGNQGTCREPPDCYEVNGFPVQEETLNCLWPVYPFMVEAKFKDQLCCIDEKPDKETQSCGFYERQECGVFGGYSRVWSECCRDTDGSLSVLFCDEAGISLVWERCKGGFSCVQHIGISSKKRGGQTGPYAQCED
jgi:hypothetical protein